MNSDNLAKLRALLQAYGERVAKTPAPSVPARGESERRLCGEKLRTLVSPLLEAVMAELRSSGHEATTRDHTDRSNAYPSVALSFTPKSQFALASALIFRYDPRHGVVVQADVKPAASGRAAAGASGERIGTIGVDALSAQWVETKTLNFIQAVLKAN